MAWFVGRSSGLVAAATTPPVSHEAATAATAATEVNKF
jgi:hypothetical protein